MRTARLSNLHIIPEKRFDTTLDVLFRDHAFSDQSWNHRKVFEINLMHKCFSHPASIMARHAIAVAVTALLLGLALQPSSAQQQDLVNSAKQRNVVNVQFYADSNLQQTMTPFAYYDFPAIQAGSCSACEDFPVRCSRRA